MQQQFRQIKRSLVIANYRSSARYLVDLLQFGQGRAERLAAAFLYSALFFGISFAILVTVNFSFGFAICTAIASLLFAFVVLSFFVLGEGDESLFQSIAEKKQQLEKLEKEMIALSAQNQQKVPSKISVGNRGGIAISNSVAPLEKRERPVVSYQYNVQDIVSNRLCPICKEEIHFEAKKCKHCGEILDRRLREQRESERAERSYVSIPLWSPGIAAVLSFLWPGLGQIYKGQIINGLCWWLITIIGYFSCLFPGVLLHLLCILGAASGDPYRRG